MTKIPRVYTYLDAEEKDLIEAFENSDAPVASLLTPRRRREIEAMARATINDARAKISLRVPQGDLTRLKSRAMQEGVPYQTLINSLIHKYVAG